MYVRNFTRAFALLAILAPGCAFLAEPKTNTGQVRLSVSEVPQGARCLRITITGVRELVKNFELTPGQHSVFSLSGVALGLSAFAGFVYDDACDGIVASSTPTWVSDVVSATVSAGITTQVALVMRRNAGSTSLDVDFEDDSLDGGTADASPGEGGVLDGAAADSQVGDAAGANDGGAGALVDASAEIPVYRDLSAGQGKESGRYPVTLVDAANQKLLVVTCNGANANRPALFRCNLDGTGCSYADLSAGQPGASGYSRLDAVIDAMSAHLLVIVAHGANDYRPALFRCNLDGSDCTYSDISVGQGKNSGFSPSAVIDPANGKLLVVTKNESVSGQPGLFRCNLDGSVCAYTDLASGPGWGEPSAVIDTKNGKLLVVTSTGPWLFRCNLDGSECVNHDLSTDQGDRNDWYASALIDSANDKLLVVAGNGANNNKQGLFRCNLDGTACTYADLSAGQGVRTGATPSAAIDAVKGRLLVAIESERSLKPALIRCVLDGTDCRYTDLSVARGDYQAFTPSVSPSRPALVIDTENNKIRVVTEDSFDRPALLSIER